MDSFQTGPDQSAQSSSSGQRPKSHHVALSSSDCARDRSTWPGFRHVLAVDLLHNGGEAGVLASRAEALDAVGRLVAGAGAGAALIDLVVDCVACDGDVLRHHSDLFTSPKREAALDPRQVPTPRLARPRLQEHGAAARVGGWWGEVVAEWVEAGLAGVRLRGLAALPHGTMAPLLRALRRQAPAAMLLADTAGAAWDDIEALAGIGLDGVASSLGWWNWRDRWFDEELSMLRRVGPVMAALPQPPLDDAALRRAMTLCAAEGLGWIAAPGQAASDGLALAASLNGGGSRRLSPPGSPVAVYLRCDGADPRWSTQAQIVLFNSRIDRPSEIDPVRFLADVSGSFKAFVAESGDAMLVPGAPVMLGVGEMRLYEAAAIAAPTVNPIDPQSAVRAARQPRLAIETPSPAVDGGQFPVKRTAGELVTVEVDVIGDGHDVLAVALQWRTPDQQGSDGHGWQETRMRLLGNDRWQANFPLVTRGMHEYRIAAWRDQYASYRHELGAKANAGVPITLELTEGRQLLQQAIARRAPGNVEIETLLEHLDAAADETARCAILLSEALDSLMQAADDRPHQAFSPLIQVEAERTAAGYASWYEVFPRSMSDDPLRHGSFRDVERHLPRIRAMGFDVLYFPPIHPIGRINRKGPNNTLTPGPEDVGSPYAVGSTEGGHDAIHPDLGTLEEFLHLREQAEAHGLEIAIDFAIQCAPDHPWLREHRDWFAWRPDGTVRYAENPPKKYQDIVNVDFYGDGAVPGLWIGLANVVMYWAEQGIRLFRVDNPHTKPLPFWQWMIAEVRARYPDSVFLAEAFTRPKVMHRLAKVGFGQSYTYFTWRNSKAELTEYLTQLSQEAPRDFFRPHFFVNTPDINPVFLQTSGRAGFLIRAALAATMSGLWGVYCGFELCEGAALPGREEYLDSEKYQMRTWDWQRPGNITAEITTLNRIRAENPALHSHLDIAFLPATNDTVLFYEKSTDRRANCVFCLVSLDPHNVQQSTIELPLHKWGLPDQASLSLEDLLGGDRFTLSGRYHTVTLTPEQPYFIWRVAPLS